MRKLIKAILLLFLVIIIGILDIGRQRHRLSVAHQNEQAALTTLHEKQNKSLTHSSVALRDKEELLDYFLTQTKLSGLTLQSLSSAKMLNEHELAVNALLRGNFSQVTDFFKRMTQSCFPYHTQRLSLGLENTEVLFSLELSVLGLCEKSSKNNIVKLKNRNPVSIRDFSIEQMRFAGYMYSPYEIAAIVTLPDDAAFDVHIGEHIGRENALVTHIDEHHLTLIFAHNKTYSLDALN